MSTVPILLGILVVPRMNLVLPGLGVVNWERGIQMRGRGDVGHVGQFDQLDDIVTLEYLATYKYISDHISGRLAHF